MTTTFLVAAPLISKFEIFHLQFQNREKSHDFSTDLFLITASSLHKNRRSIQQSTDCLWNAPTQTDIFIGPLWICGMEPRDGGSEPLVSLLFSGILCPQMEMKSSYGATRFPISSFGGGDLVGAYSMMHSRPRIKTRQRIKCNRNGIPL